MLALFRNNQVTTALMIALFTGLIRMPALMGFISPDTTPVDGAGNLYLLLFGWASNAPFLSALVSAILVFIQALLMNWMVNTSRVNPERNWLVPLFYVLAMSCVADFQFLSPPLVAATFFPIVYRLIFDIYKSSSITLITFDAGVLLATAALFYVPIIWLLPIGLLSILHLRSIKTRDIMVFLLGAFVPGFIGWSIAVWFDQGAEFRREQFRVLFEFWDFNLDFSLVTIAQIGLLILLLMIVLFSYNIYYFKRLIQVQKYNNIFYWLIFAVIVSILLRNQPQIEHFLLAGTGISTFLALTFQSMRNKAIAEVLFLALVVLSLTVMFLDKILGI
ncbi:MAG: hypothetical protein RIR11_3624 [Bacteroidota bacterium]